MKKTTVTIGIPAYNEENNIKILLESILSQKEEGFIIKKIIVTLDGCTDSTLDKVKEVKNRKIELIIGKKRAGKSARMNQIIKLFNTDILVFLDADIILYSSDSIRNLINPLRENKVGLTCGKLIQKNNSAFIEKSINTTLKTYHQFFESVNHGNNVFAIKGSLIALSKNFAKSVLIPRNLYANDTYLYFDCISKGYKFRYTKSSRAWYYVPSNVKDQINQNLRFVGAASNLENFFGASAPKEFNDYKLILYKFMIINFLKDPFHSSSIFLINLYSKMKARYAMKKIDSQWEVSTSTKGGSINV